MGTCSSMCTDKNQPRSVKEEPRSPSDTQPLSPELSSGGASSVLCECRLSSAPSGSTPTPLVRLSYTDAFTSVGADTTLCLEGFNGCRGHSSSRRAPFACRSSAQGNPNDNILERAPQGCPLNSFHTQPEQARWLRLLRLLLQ